MNWLREPRVVVKRLPDERKALAERYTIDADEAERREQLAAEQAARQAEADEAARKAAAEEAAKKDAESAALRAAADSARRAAEQEAARRAAEEAAAAAAAAAAAEAERETYFEPIEASSPPQPVLGPVDDPPAPTEIAAGNEPEQTLDLPIYRWFGND